MHFKYAPGALCIQICSWNIFDLEYYSRLFMLLEQLLLEHNLGPKSHKSDLARLLTTWLGSTLRWGKEFSFSSKSDSTIFFQDCKSPPLCAASQIIIIWIPNVKTKRAFAWRGTHLYAHDFSPLLGFLLFGAVWRKNNKKHWNFWFTLQQDLKF